MRKKKKEAGHVRKRKKEKKSPLVQAFHFFKMLPFCRGQIPLHNMPYKYTKELCWCFTYYYGTDPVHYNPAFCWKQFPPKWCKHSQNKRPNQLCFGYNVFIEQLLVEQIFAHGF